MKNRKLYLENDMLVKELTWDIDDYWLWIYQKLHKFEPRIVEVYGYNNRKIYMEYVKGNDLVTTANNETYGQMVDICANILKFSEQNNISFYHHDLHFKNFLVESETNRVVLIDPDSFHLYENGMWI